MATRGRRPGKSAERTELRPPSRSVDELREELEALGFTLTLARAPKTVKIVERLPGKYIAERGHSSVSAGDPEELLRRVARAPDRGRMAQREPTVVLRDAS